MGKRIWEFQALSQISDDTKFLVSDGETTRVVPGSLINQIDSKISSIISGTAEGVNVAEIVDARIRGDGQTAASLGDAIRWLYTHFSNMSSDAYREDDIPGGIFTFCSMVVAKKAGWCHVTAEIELSETLNDWTEVLSATQVPAPQYGKNLYPAATNWKTSFVRAARVRVSSTGGLYLRYGEAGVRYNFETTYPIA